MTVMRALSSSSEDGMMILMFFFVPLDMMLTAFLFEVAVNGADPLYEVPSCLRLLLYEYPSHARFRNYPGGESSTLE